MEKYKTEHISKLVKEDGLGYSLEKYYNMDGMIEDPELEELWKQGKEILKTISKKLEETEEETIEKMINRYISLAEKNGISLKCEANTLYDTIYYEIFSEEYGKIIEITWEDCDFIAFMLFENLYPKGTVVGLMERFEKIDEFETDDEKFGRAYQFQSESIFDVYDLLVELNSKLLF